MNTTEIESFCRYEVYTYIDEKKYTFCVCKNYDEALIIVKLLAAADESHASYYITGITEPFDLVPGGGWYVGYHTDKKGKLRKESLC